ncbi:hypothetical protein AAY473_001606 [Plecturocebus cupreus]
MEFHHFGQAGLELLTSDDPSALASQSAGITCVSHRASTTFINSIYTQFGMLSERQFILPLYLCIKSSWERSKMAE